MIKKNMNNIDRSLRVVIGIGLVYFGFVESNWVDTGFIPMLLGLIGVANFIFAVSGFCPLYVLAGLNFAKQKSK